MQQTHAPQRTAYAPMYRAGQRSTRNAVLRKLLGGRMALARERLGMDQLSAAITLLGYANSTQLSLIEKGHRMPPHEVIARAARLYGTSLDYLYGLRRDTTATQGTEMQQIPLTLDHARDRGALGMERAAARAERKHAGWAELALNAMRLHLHTLPGDVEFIVEDLRVAVESKIPAPTDLRAWGAVTQSAIRHLIIEPTGKFAKAKSSNASPKPLYRKGRAL